MAAPDARDVVPDPEAASEPWPIPRTGDRVDLHAHTTVSDGTLAPRELVQHAADLGLTALAVTDHDHVGGIPMAQRAGNQLGVEVIPGIEFSAEHGDLHFHMLGFLFDPDDAALGHAISEVQRYRADRNPRIIAKLNELGIDVTMEEVEARASGGLVGRPHMARVLVDKGAAASVQEAFDVYLGEGGEAYLPKKRIPAEEAIALLHGAGGVAVMAHPITVEAHRLPDLLPALLELGLDGLEVVHSKHGPAERARFAALAAEHNLVPTGGSDFHGSNKPGVDLATGVEGNVDVRYATLDALRERATRYR